MEKYHASDDADFKARAVAIKEERSDLVKHHLWVLWTDYFKAPHFEKYPQLNTLFNEATKLAGAGGTKGTQRRRGGRQAARQDRRDRRDLLGDQGGVTSPEDLPGAPGRDAVTGAPGTVSESGDSRRAEHRTSRAAGPPGGRAAILAMVRELAEYERSAHEVAGDRGDDRRPACFGTNTPSGAPAAYCHVAADTSRPG